MKQVFHPYQEWEGYQCGMYEPKKVGRERRVIKAGLLLANPSLLRKNMLLVTEQWPNETEHVLTDKSISHRAWLGQSACMLFGGCREDETREAWGYLTENKRKEANRVADWVDSHWCEQYESTNQLAFDLGDA